MVSIKKINNKRLFYLIFLILGLGLIYLLFSWYYRFPPFYNDVSDRYVNWNKTETEKAAINKIQEDPSQKTQNEQKDTPTASKTDNQTGLEQANVLITNVDVSQGQVSVSGFISNIIEDGGICSYVFKSRDIIVTKETKTLPSSTSTSCKTLVLPTSEFSVNGTWSVIIEYKSSQSAGTSSQRVFNI